VETLPEYQEISWLMRETKELEELVDISLQQESLCKKKLSEQRHILMQLTRKQEVLTNRMHMLQEEARSHSGSALTTREPILKTVWLSGFQARIGTQRALSIENCRDNQLSLIESREDSWIHSVPNRVCRRYTESQVYVLRKDRVSKSSPDFWNHPFTIHKLPY